MISRLLKDVDERWISRTGNKVRLKIIGSTALMLQTDYTRGTKDSDVIQTDHLTTADMTQLRSLAGQGTDLHQKHRLYVDIVAAALPFLPHVPRYHPRPELTSLLRHFEVETLDIVDVVVSKLKRFNANDNSDIEAMIERGLLPHEALVTRFMDAVDSYQMDARASDLSKYVSNLHVVERDMLLVPTTAIDLPPWAD
jgi:hypothetical protein